MRPGPGSRSPPGRVASPLLDGVFPCAYGEPESPTSPPTRPRTGARHKSMTIETARRASLEFVLCFLDRTGADSSLLESSADALDAVVCVLAAMDFLDGRAMAPPRQAVAEQEGWIWAMPRPSPPWPVIVRDSSAPHAGSAWIFLILLSEEHLHRLLTEWRDHYNRARPHFIPRARLSHHLCRGFR